MDADDASSPPRGRWKRRRSGWWKRKRLWILLLLLTFSLFLTYWLIRLLENPAKPE